MNQIPTPVQHPLAIGDRAVAKKPSCPCKGATFSNVDGVVMKVIHNQTGYWYYLSSGVTIRGEWVTEVQRAGA